MKRFILFWVIMLSFLTASVVTAEDDYVKGLSFYKKRDFRASIKYLLEYTNKTPDPGAYYLIGYANYKLKNHEAAIKYFKDTYMLEPNFKPSAIEMK